MKPDSGIPVVDSAVGRRHVQPTPVRRRLRQVQSWAILTLLGAASVVFAACGDTTPTPSDDSLIWQYDTGTEGELVIVSPTVTGGVVYAGSYEDRVYALDAESGELLWTFEADSDLSPPPPVVQGRRAVPCARFPVGTETGKPVAFILRPFRLSVVRYAIGSHQGRNAQASGDRRELPRPRSGPARHAANIAAGPREHSSKRRYKALPLALRRGLRSDRLFLLQIFVAFGHLNHDDCRHRGNGLYTSIR